MTSSSGQVGRLTHPAERTQRRSSVPSSDNDTVWSASKQYPYEPPQTVEEEAMRNVPGITVFEPAEIDDLQSRFDHPRTPRNCEIGDDAEAITRALILAYKRGVADRHELIRLADFAVDEQQPEDGKS